MIPKLSGACYAIRLMVHINNINTLKSIFYAHFHSLIKYEIIFWGTYSNSRKIFTLQKKIVRIMAGAQPRTSCRSLFKQLEILTVPCQYILSLENLIINNQEFFQTNSSLHNTNTRNKHHLHRPNTNLSCLQKSTFYAGTKIFNSLPPSVTILQNDKAKFKSALRKYIHIPFTLKMNFFMCKDDIYNTVFVKVCSIFYCKFVYSCIYGLFHILLSLTHLWFMQCLYICKFVM